jgi:tRNA threonylcarbamoyladenosine biosynthesis protein TsaB
LDCAEKGQTVLTKENFTFLEEIKYLPQTRMSALSFEKYKKSDTVDVAYFEPLPEDFMVTHFKRKCNS